jgi:DNA-binding cell septation regulator SpoVG
MTAPLVTDVRITAALRHDQDRGLLAFVSCTVAGALRIDGLTVRRTRSGDTRLSFPSRRDGRGLNHPYFEPLDAATERALEDAILAALLGAGEGEES